MSFLMQVVECAIKEKTYYTKSTCMFTIQTVQVIYRQMKHESHLLEVLKLYMSRHSGLTNLRQNNLWSYAMGIMQYSITSESKQDPVHSRAKLKGQACLHHHCFIQVFDKTNITNECKMVQIKKIEHLIAISLSF